MNFLFTIDNNYIEPIETLLFSISYNMGEDHKFYFLYQDILLENRNKIIEFSRNQCKSEAIFVEYLDDKLNQLPINGTWSKDIYLRLFAPYILKDVDIILYLDGDTIVNGDLSELLGLDGFEDFALAAVPNDVQESHKLRLGLSEQDTYINSGILLMNLKKIRQMYSLEEIVGLLFGLKEQLIFPDQDFINIVFKGQIKLIDRRYNYMINVTERVNTYTKIKDFKICHYVLAKPWNEEFSYKTDWLYFQYLIRRKMYKKAVFLLYKHRKVRMWYKIQQIKGKIFGCEN